MSMNEEQTFLGHLEVLRFIIFKILGVFCLLLIPAWAVSQKLIDLMLEYAAPKGFSLHYFSLMEPFFIRLKMCLTLALFLSLPFTFYFIWKFVAPGLLEYERKMLKGPLWSAFFLALFGIAFAMLFIVPAIVSFSLSFAGPQMQPVIGIDSFVSMVLVAVLACGLLFQFPLILYGLLSCGIVELDTLRRHRPAVIVIILTVAAILTPPDVLSQVLLAVPTYLLFELSLVVFRLNKKRFEQKQPAFADDSVYKDEERKGGQHEQT